MADDDVQQITHPIIGRFLVPARSPALVNRIRGLAPVSRVARAAQAFHKLEPAEPIQAGTAPRPPSPQHETHELLTPQTAATLSQMHAVESELMIRAMIEAAKADGKIEGEERRRILACLKDVGTNDLDRHALLAAMDGPPDMEAMAARVTSPELAVEVYAASLLAIKDDKPSEQRYLARLAARLDIPAETVAAMHARFGDPPPLPEA